MTYLMIENKSECPLEGFTKLGVSSHRNNEDCIGQFGSGLKMGILTLLRHELYPVCYVGTGKIEYELVPKRMGDTEYTDVYAKLSGKFGDVQVNRKQELGFVLEYGSLDWTKIEYALREFISNAFDQSGVEGTNLAIVDKPRAKKGTTRIFVPYTWKVEEYINKKHEYFLHFSNRHKKSVLSKSKTSNLQLYRKGVYVTESYLESLFDYNFNDEIEIDESRNLKNYDFSDAVGNLLSNSRHELRTVLEHVVSGEKKELSEKKELYEVLKLDRWKVDCQKVGTLFKEMYGDVLVCSDPFYKVMGEEKGYKVLQVPNNWERILAEGGVRRVIEINHYLENKGCTIIPPTQEMLDLVRHVWDQIEKVGMTNNKSIPVVKGFVKPVDNSTLLLGFVDSNRVVYLNKDVVNKKTVLEELAHYVTNADDGSKDFEDFILRFASNLI